MVLWQLKCMGTSRVVTAKIQPCGIWESFRPKHGAFETGKYRKWGFVLKIWKITVWRAWFWSRFEISSQILNWKKKKKETISVSLLEIDYWGNQKELSSVEQQDGCSDCTVMYLFRVRLLFLDMRCYHCNVSIERAVLLITSVRVNIAIRQ